jgi:homoserine kinase
MTSVTRTAFAPGSIGNVGPGFDVLGLAFEGAGDRVTIELTDGDAEVVDVTGRDAELIPREPSKNVCTIAATAWLRAHGDRRNPRVWLEKGLPLAGGMGGSAASSVAAAYAAALACGVTPRTKDVIVAALEGESAVAGRHLDNIAASVLGGLALTRSVDPLDVVALPVKCDWFVALVTPAIRIETKAARGVLPASCEQRTWIQQMANTAAVAHAFASGDGELLLRSCEDLYAEPHRASLIPRFQNVKQAALDAGAIFFAISGSGPTLAAIGEDETAARRVANAMQRASGDGARSLVGAIARRGVREE